jgi:hypothetical protein
MSSQWVESATGLPHNGQPVEFVLDGRQVAMIGTYLRQTFWSRWSGYDVQRVRTWRSADMGLFNAPARSATVGQCGSDY